MKKIVSYILLASILVLQFSGCGAEEKEVLDTSGTEEIQGTGSLNDQEESVKQDSPGEAYSMAVNAPLRVEEPVGAIGGGGGVFLGASRAYRFKKHVFEVERADECWDELSFVTAEGEMGSESFDRENQVWGVGPMAGTDHYVTFDYEADESGENCRYFLTERDESHGALREFPLNYLDGSDFVDAVTNLSSFAVDRSGVVHIVQQIEERGQYLLVSPEGETLAEYIPEDGDIKGLVPLYDGRVAFQVERPINEEREFQVMLWHMDVGTGRPELLAAPEKEISCFTLFDENTLLYADHEGLYRRGLSGNDPEILFRWSKHGINGTKLWISAMQADEEGRIALICDNSDYNHYYLYLKPTAEGAEDADICRITLAVSSYRKSVYQPLVVEFNKRYPNYRIELKSDYEESALLTELAAGKGPVLLDVRQVQFEEQEKLWEPLDTVMAQSGITEELLPSVLEMGKINGTLYGIVTDFSLRTLVTGDPDLKDWDYDTFLQCVESRPELEAIFNMYGGDYGTYFIMNILSHGMGDTYLLDAEEGTMNFDSREFRRVLELAKKYCVREEAVDPGISLVEGKVLCNELTISKPEELAAYRICYRDNVNYIGYPTKDGAAHFIEGGGSPLAIRRTATKEEKEAAAAFIGFCLSYDGQSIAAKDINFGLSVRRDVLEKQIVAMNESTEVFIWGFGQDKLGDDLNIELDRKNLLDMIDKAKPIRYFPMEMRNIMFEELEPFFAGAITEDMVINHLESRVGLYLGERN